MIDLCYSDSKEKDLVEGWAKYANKMNFTTNIYNLANTFVTSSNDWLKSDVPCFTDICVQNTNPYELQLEAEHIKVKQIIKFKPI